MDLTATVTVNPTGVLGAGKSRVWPKPWPGLPPEPGVPFFRGENLNGYASRCMSTENPNTGKPYCPPGQYPWNHPVINDFAETMDRFLFPSDWFTQGQLDEQHRIAAAQGTQVWLSTPAGPVPRTDHPVVPPGVPSVMPAPGGKVWNVAVRYPPPQTNIESGEFGPEDTLAIHFVTPGSDTRGHGLALVGHGYGSYGCVRKMVLSGPEGVLRTVYSQTPTMSMVVGDQKFNTSANTVRLKPFTAYTVTVANRAPDGSVSSLHPNNNMRIDFNN